MQSAGDQLNVWRSWGVKNPHIFFARVAGEVIILLILYLGLQKSTSDLLAKKT
jgi:hypothetical protein